jgi:hypothetical protein
MQLLADVVSAVEAKYTTGTGNQANLFQAQLMQTNVSNRLLLLRGMPQAAEERREGPVGARVTVAPLGEVRELFYSIDSSYALQKVISMNPELAASEEMVRKARSVWISFGRNTPRISPCRQSGRR